MLLCRPCAEQLKAEGKVKIVTSIKDKQTCKCCQKRRFVYFCRELQPLEGAQRKELCV